MISTAGCLWESIRVITAIVVLEEGANTPKVKLHIRRAFDCSFMPAPFFPFRALACVVLLYLWKSSGSWCLPCGVLGIRSVNRWYWRLEVFFMVPSMSPSPISVVLCWKLCTAIEGLWIYLLGAFYLATGFSGAHHRIKEERKDVDKLSQELWTSSGEWKMGERDGPCTGSHFLRDDQFLQKRCDVSRDLMLEAIYSCNWEDLIMLEIVGSPLNGKSALETHLSHVLNLQQQKLTIQANGFMKKEHFSDG